MTGRGDDAAGAPWSRLPTVWDRDVHATEFGRVLALSDGVFAIALTLLVLDVALAAGGTRGALGAELVERQAHFFAFAISLLLVGSTWWNHHRLFAMLRGIDGPLAALNVVYLGFVVLIPFVQSVLAAYPTVPLAYVLFASVLAGTGVADASLFLYARRRGLLRVRLTRGATRRELLQSAVLVGSFLLSMPLAYLIGPYTVVIWLSQGLGQLLIVRLLAEPATERAGTRYSG